MYIHIGLDSQRPRSARRSTVGSTALVGAATVAKALGNRDKLEAVVLGPVDEPGGKRVDGRGIRLVHETDVAVSACAGLLELLLALLRRLAVPVFAVHVRRDDAVAQVAHRRQHVAARGQVRRAHVRGLHPNDVDESLLEPRHLRRQVVGRQRSKVLRVRPSVRGNLVSGLVGILQCRSLVVDASYGCVRIFSIKKRERD